MNRLVEWACGVEGRVMSGFFMFEKRPLVFTHWTALFILFVYNLLHRLGVVSGGE